MTVTNADEKLIDLKQHIGKLRRDIHEMSQGLLDASISEPDPNAAVAHVADTCAAQAIVRILDHLQHYLDDQETKPAKNKSLIDIWRQDTAVYE